MPLPIVAKAGAWLVGSRAGLIVLLVGAIAVSAGLTYWWISDRAYDRGVADCQAAQAEAIGEANTAVVEKEREQAAAASGISRDADEAAARATGSTDEATLATKEVIRHVYHEVPVTTACVPRPLDERVQDRFDAAVDQANRAGR